MSGENCPNPSPTDLTSKTELSYNKEVRFFVCPVLAYSWRVTFSYAWGTYFFWLHEILTFYIRCDEEYTQMGRID